MQLRVAAWLDAAVEVRTLPALKDTIDLWISQLGFRYFVYHGHFSGARGAVGEIHLDTTPPAWRHYCLTHGLDSTWDLLCTRVLRATPIMWCRIQSLHPALFEKAREFGIATGITQPMHGPDGEWSSVSFIKDRAGQRAERELLAAIPYCQLLAALVHDAAARIAPSLSASPVESQRPSESALSERESTCLGLAASGKTIPQIAKILPISARTVAFHLVNARRKLQAASLRHAVTKAASLGLIRAA